MFCAVVACISGPATNALDIMGGRPYQIKDPQGTMATSGLGGFGGHLINHRCVVLKWPECDTNVAQLRNKHERIRNLWLKIIKKQRSLGWVDRPYHAWMMQRCILPSAHMWTYSSDQRGHREDHREDIHIIIVNSKEIQQWKKRLGQQRGTWLMDACMHGGISHQMHPNMTKCKGH